MRPSKTVSISLSALLTITPPPLLLSSTPSPFLSALSNSHIPLLLKPIENAPFFFRLIIRVFEPLQLFSFSGRSNFTHFFLFQVLSISSFFFFPFSFFPNQIVLIPFFSFLCFRISRFFLLPPPQVCGQNVRFLSAGSMSTSGFPFFHFLLIIRVASCF